MCECNLVYWSGKGGKYIQDIAAQLCVHSIAPLGSVDGDLQDMVLRSFQQKGFITFLHTRCPNGYS